MDNITTQPQIDQPGAQTPPADPQGAPSTPVHPAPQPPVVEPPKPATGPTEPQGIPDAWKDYSTGNAVLDTSIAAVLQTMGSNPQEFSEGIQKAIEYGDPSLIDSAMLDKYKQYAPMLKSFTEAIIAQNANNATAVTQTAYSIAGSKENWDQAVQIFNANAPDYLRETVKLMIDSGKTEAGCRMVMDAVRGLGAMPNTMPPYQGGASPNRGYSYDEMKAELGKLIEEAGGASLESGTYGRRYQEIMERRKLGRQQGL